MFKPLVIALALLIAITYFDILVISDNRQSGDLSLYGFIALFVVSFVLIVWGQIQKSRGK